MRILSLLPSKVTEDLELGLDENRIFIDGRPPIRLYDSRVIAPVSELAQIDLLVPCAFR